MSGATEGGSAGREALDALLRLTTRLCGRRVDLTAAHDAPDRLEGLTGVEWRRIDAEPDSGALFEARAAVVSGGRTVAALVVSGLAACDEDLAEILADAALTAARAWDLAAVAETSPIPHALRHLAENAPVAMAIQDRDMRILYVNDRWRFEFDGWAVGEVVGRTLYEIDPATQALETYYQNCLRGERLQADQYPLRLADGRILPIACTHIPWHRVDGEVGGVLSMYRLQTEASGDSYELARTQQRLETAVRLAGIQVWEMDQDTKTMWALGLEADFFKVDPHVAVGRFEDLSADPFAIVHPADRAACEAEAVRALAEGRPYRAEHRLHYSPEDIWISSAFETKYSEDGRPLSVLGVMTDISVRKKAELSVVEALAVAEAANQAKSEFLANMSHEIRTPMNGVIGMNGLLLKTALTAEQRKFAEAVRLSAEGLMSILNDILEISKLEAGRVELETMDFSLADLVEDAVELLAPRAQEKGLELGAYVGAEARGVVHGDPTRLRQILLNLLSNAVKFTETGHVGVEVKGVHRPSGEIGLRIEVEDTGIGLSAEAKTKLFQKFQQADGSITRRYGGTGLGLSICRQLVQMMAGEIGVSDAPGGGAVFWVELDLPHGEAAARPRRKDLTGARILVVDDLELNRTIFRRQLEDCGAIVGEAENAAESYAALDAAAQSGQPYQLVLLDQMMPDISGDIIARTIRATPAWGQPAIVAASSMGEPTGGKDAGFDAFLSKPVRYKDLISCLCVALGSEAETDPAATAGVEDEVLIGGGELRVLLAEDNEINTLLARTVLEQVGFNVTCVSNGAEAVEAFAAGGFDLVLMDVQMPVLDGLEATRRIRAAGGAGATVPIVAMTANAMKRDRESCLEAGMNDFVAKPIDMTAFMAVLERLMGDTPAQAQDAA